MTMARARGEYLSMAKLASVAERFEEAASTMEKLVAALAPGEELTAEELNLFCDANMNAISARVASLKLLSTAEQREKEKGEAERVALVLEYRDKIVAELYHICNGALRLLDDRLIAASSGIESKVKFLKMKGHCHHSLAKFTTGDEKMDAVKETLTAYRAAKKIAETELPPTNSVRLGLALDFSVFYSSILESPDEAIALAQKAYDEAKAELNASPGKEFDKDSTLILEALFHNLTLWTAG